MINGHLVDQLSCGTCNSKNKPLNRHLSWTISAQDSALHIASAVFHPPDFTAAISSDNHG